MEKTVQHLMKGNYQDKNEVLDAIKEYRNLRLLNHEEEQTEVIRCIVFFSNLEKPFIIKIFTEFRNELINLTAMKPY